MPPKHEPNKPHNPTCTEPTITILGILQEYELQCLKLHTKIPLKIANTGATGRGSTLQQHADQLPAPLLDPGSMRRKRQRPQGEITQSPLPHTISRMNELLDTCTDAQYIQIIKSLPTEWSATNDRGMTVTKRQLEMAQWQSYKDDHNVLTFKQLILNTRHYPNTITQFDTLLAHNP